MTTGIIWWNEKSEDNASVGTKFSSLQLLQSLGLNVPPAVALSTEFFGRWLKDAGLEGEYLSTLTESRLSIRERLDALFGAHPFSKAHAEALASLLAPLGDTLAVRSSFALEDGSSFAHAGQFLTVPSVSRLDSTALASAVQAVWASRWGGAFTSDKAPLSLSEALVSVCLQSWKEFVVSGVAFSRSPTTGQREFFMEWSPQSAAICSGQGGVALHRWNGQPEEMDATASSLESGLSLDHMKKLGQILQRLEEHFPNGVDLEWGLDEAGTLWCLQARDITVHRKTLLQHAQALGRNWFGFHDADLQQLDMGAHYEKLLTKFLTKRYWIRNTARAHGFRTPELGMLVLGTDKQTLESGLEDAMRHILTPVVLVKPDNAGVMSIKNSKLVRRDKVLETIQDYARQGQVATSVHLSEFHEPTMCGIATLTSDGDCLVEYLPGDLGGLFKATSRFSKVMIDGKTAEIKAFEPQIANTQYFFNEAKGKVESVTCAPFQQRLTGEQCQDILRLTQVLTEKFGEVRVEWHFAPVDTLGHSALLLNDLSLEKPENRLQIASDGNNWLMSPGTSEGPALVLSASLLADLENSLSKRPSVIAEASERQEAEEAPAFAELKELLKRPDGKKSVVVAPFPAISLSFFLECAAGFVFAEGAILSHLGIILRQAKIPAVVSKNTFETVQDGEALKIDGPRIVRAP